MPNTKVHWLVHSPSPYNSELFTYLHSEASFELKVTFQNSNIDSHPWTVDLLQGYSSRNAKYFFGVDWYLVREALSTTGVAGRRKCFIVGSWTGISNWLLFVVLFFIRRHCLIVWTDTPNQLRNRWRVKSFLRRTALRLLFRRANFIMGTGDPAVQILQKMGASSSKTVSFPYWIDNSKFFKAAESKMALECSQPPVIFISTGLLVNDRKGHDIVLLAIAELAKRGIRNLEFRIAGAGPDEVNLRDLAERLGISNSVVFLGWVEPPDLPVHLSKADVYIHPSPIIEPYGVAVIEAMAAGLPVLASDQTYAAIDRVVEGESGYIHRASNHHILADHMQHLVLDRDRLSRMSEASLTVSRSWPLSRSLEILDPLIYPGCRLK